MNHRVLIVFLYVNTGIDQELAKKKRNEERLKNDARASHHAHNWMKSNHLLPHML